MEKSKKEKLRKEYEKLRRLNKKLPDFEGLCKRYNLVTNISDLDSMDIDMLPLMIAGVMVNNRLSEILKIIDDVVEPKPSIATSVEVGVMDKFKDKLMKIYGRISLIERKYNNLVINYDKKKVINFIIEIDDEYKRIQKDMDEYLSCLIDEWKNFINKKDKNKERETYFG